MKFTKGRKRRRHISRTDADIIAAKQMFDDRRRGLELAYKFYDELSDSICGKPSRGIYQ